jgi:protein-disulfide isomerase
MKTEWMLNLATGTLTLCALAITALVVRQEFFPKSPSGALRPQVISGAREYSRAGHRTGPADAPVTIVAFSDFQCPFCGVAAERLRTLREQYPKEIAIVYRHFPLDIHPHAIAAARASECAAVQGRFQAFHDALYAAQDSIGLAPWERFAATAGVPDTSAFAVCAAGTAPLPALERDTLAGKRLQVRGTPTLLVNETRFQGAPPLDSLEAYVQRALRSRMR